MAAETLNDTGSQRSPRESPGNPKVKKSVTESPNVRFSVAEPDTSEAPIDADPSKTDRKSSKLVRPSIRSGNVEASDLGKQGPSAASKPASVLLGSDGKPLSILKGSRQYGYVHARRLAEQLRVKFAVERNETRFYCPDSDEHADPPVAPAELRSNVLSFLKASKKAVQESQELAQTAQSQVEESKQIEEQLEAMTQSYAETLELRKNQQKAKQAQQARIVTKAPPPQRRCFCFSG